MLVLIDDNKDHILNVGVSSKKEFNSNISISKTDTRYLFNRNYSLFDKRTNPVFYFKDKIEPYYSSSFKTKLLKRILENRMKLQEEQREVVSTKVREIVKAIYPNNSDCVIDNSGNLHINILFSDIEITDGENFHSIKDLYIKFIFAGGMYFVNDIFGTRGKNSLLEMNRSYKHSHIDPRSTCSLFEYCSWGKYCTGTTDLTDSLNDIRLDTLEWNNKWEINFELLLCRLKDLLTWESIEGVPFFYLKDLKKQGEVKEDFFHIETVDVIEAVSFLEKKKVELELQFEQLGEIGRYFISTDIASFFHDIENEPFLQYYQLIDFKNGVFFSKNFLKALLYKFRKINDVPLSIPNFTYKGKQVLLELTDYNRYKNPPEEVTIKVSKAFIKKTKELLEKRINIFILTQLLNGKQRKKKV